MKKSRGQGRIFPVGSIALALWAALATGVPSSSRAQAPAAKSVPDQSKTSSPTQTPGSTRPGKVDAESQDPTEIPGMTPEESFQKKEDDRRPETPMEKLKDLGDLDELEKKAKERAKPPLEIYMARVAPFDVLPFVKPGHWSTLAIEAQANLNDYDGILQTDSVALTKKQQVLFRRGARLVKKQQTRLSLQIFLPEFRKELPLELGRTDSIRADLGYSASLQSLAPHQMLVIALARDPSLYMPWGSSQAFVSPMRDLRASLPGDQRRYYRMVVPLVPDRPFLSTHPLTWSTTSHVVWDNLNPDALSSDQQQALIDWLHSGGQLIVIGGAGSNLPALQDSFLGAYLPAESAGETTPLTKNELDSLAEAYPPPLRPDDWPDPDTRPVVNNPKVNPAAELSRLLRSNSNGPYARTEPIRPLKDRPIYLSVLKPRDENSVSIPVGEIANDPARPLGVERRVGRGRVLMLGINPTDPSIAGWKGFDTFLRRVILRRPEEPWNAGRFLQSRMLGAPELSWYRLLGRDLEPRVYPLSAEPGEVGLPKDTVAEWSDESKLPRLCRETLEDASGISVPPRSFVLRVIIGYALAIVPLNYLLCRFVFRKRELAWVFLPVLSLGFAVAVERGAARQLGFDSARDEIDLLEIHADYPRAHLSRIAALYSTGRVQFTVNFPDDPSALALPFSRTDILATSEITQTTWESVPEPALRGFLIQPRSLALYRAEQMHPMGGVIHYSTKPTRQIVNKTTMNLYDAVVVDVGANNELRKTPIGAILAGATIDLDAVARAGETRSKPKVDLPKIDWTKIEPFLETLGSYTWAGPENVGEKRLVAWTPDPRSRQTVSPAVDRVRGFTLVVVHLAESPPPSPFLKTYDGSGSVADSK